MARRRRISEEVKTEQVEEEPTREVTRAKNLEFIPTGCVNLDCVIGGGWVLGRMSNIVGDKSTGKTLCAIEAAANFARRYPDGKIFYREAEAAFDEDYGASLGLPVDRVDFGEEGLGTAWETVEDIYEDLVKCCDECIKEGVPGFYVIDSLDALSSRAELGRAIDEGSYGMEKQKQLGQLFRRLVRRIKEARICLMVISQVREKIGVAFGDKYRRSGGKALDFYASQVVYLSHLKTLKRSIKGAERAYGIRVKAKCTKNKISLPFRECEFSLRFGYGIDELPAAIEWLEQVKHSKEILDGEAASKYIDRVNQLGRKEFNVEMKKVRKHYRRVWNEIENRFVPPRSKY